MADITMCRGETCPLRETCYRYLAIPDEHGQSYFASDPNKDTKKNNEICKYYWEWKKIPKTKLTDETFNKF